MEIYIGGGPHDHNNNHYGYSQHKHSVGVAVKSPKALIWMGITILIIIGVIFAIFYNTLFKSNGFIEKEAVIVDNYASFDYDTGYYVYSPIAEFEVDGVKYTVKGNTSSSIPEILGKIVVIKYNPNNPRDAMFKQSNFTIIFVIVIFAVFAIIAISLIISGIRKLRRGEDLS